jgi:uncharacterized membrane protein YccC
LLRWLAARDPHWYALRRAARAAVIVPVNFAIGAEVIGNAQVATFAAFGSFALLLFANFAGGLAARAGAYAVLSLAGVALIALGTEAATPDWLAVLAMAVVAFALLFAGVISSMIGGASQAALLAFILAVMLPGGRSALPDRLAGWAIAVVISVPVALFVWPPRDQDQIRLRAAALCRAIGDMLALDPPPAGSGDPLVAMRQAARDLRTAFRTSAIRTAGLSTGARTMIRLVDEVEWLANAVANACADAPEQWPVEGRRLRTAAADVMRACGTALDHAGSGPDRGRCLELDERLEELEAARRSVAQETLTELQAQSQLLDGEAVRGDFDRPLYAAHELGYVVALAGRTVATISAADARSWWARVTGRRVTEDELGVIAVAQRAASSQLDRHAVWLQSSIRGAMGLALAVLVARVVDAQNAFWIGLGALSVLRSTALSTGSTVLRALAGTTVGFAVGGAIVAVLGTSHAVLWPLLPVAILVAASAPGVISFVVGQAAFTVLTIILFNIIAPAGWRIGVLRVEDVALGCAASLGAGLLFWPRGAGAALGNALGEAYHAAAAYLRESVEHVTGLRMSPPESGLAAMAAGERLDEALRQYLAEQGTKQVPLESVAALANGAARVRLAGTAIKRLPLDTPAGRLVGSGDESLDVPVDVLVRRMRDVAGWYEMLAEAFARPGSPLPQDGSSPGESFLDVVLPAIDRCGDPERAAHAEQLLWSGQYVGDVDQLRHDLLTPAAQVAAARAGPWWSAGR